MLAPVQRPPAAGRRPSVRSPIFGRALAAVTLSSVVPIRREGGRYVVAEADLSEVERYFRENPRGTARGGAAGLARAGRR